MNSGNANINSEIRAYLDNQRSMAYNVFKASVPLTNQAKIQFDSLNLEVLSQQFYRELIINCKEYWLEAIELIDGVVFEYDPIHKEDQEADAYGILFNGHSVFKIQPDSYYLGFGISFATLFEAAPGITLTMLNSLIPYMTYTFDKIDKLDKFEELMKAYTFTVYLALHDALVVFTKTDEYSQMNKHFPFHFLIGRHEHPSQPVYVDI